MLRSYYIYAILCKKIKNMKANPISCYKNILLLLAVFPLLLGAQMIETSNKTEKILIFKVSTGKAEQVEKIYKTNKEWKKILTPEQYNVTRLKGTEKPFSQQCSVPEKGEEGVYQCVSCGTDLFIAGTKFESGTGWPSFWGPVSLRNIREIADDSLGAHRVEVLCARCDAHLGHVFEDGPPPSGKRYCINSAAIKLVINRPEKKGNFEKAAFAAGCFWGVEAAFAQVKGVVKTTAGYTGGKLKNPGYKDVSTGKTGHAEAVELEYDPKVISYDKLLDIFWNIHDPTTENRQGPDVGSQYRSVIFYYTKDQEKSAKLSKKKLEESGKVRGTIVTEIIPAGEFYKAEEYHQKYYEKSGNSPSCHL